MLKYGQLSGSIGRLCCVWCYREVKRWNVKKLFNFAHRTVFTVGRPESPVLHWEPHSVWSYWRWHQYLCSIQLIAQRFGPIQECCCFLYRCCKEVNHKDITLVSSEVWLNPRVVAFRLCKVYSCSKPTLDLLLLIPVIDHYCEEFIDANWSNTDQLVQLCVAKH